MDITSSSFIFLSVVSVFIYYLINHKYRILFLTLLSCSFIMTYSYKLVLYVILYSIINYIIGIGISKYKNKRGLFILGIIFNLSQLILLKYASFTINPILQLLNIDFDTSIFARYIVPVGISFFSLQGIGYLINIKMGWEKAEYNFVHFLLYIIFYPRFLSGPIDRSNHFLPQLKLIHEFDIPRVTQGFRLILFGLIKKVIIANQLAPIVNGTYENLNSSTEYSLWIILLLQPIYIYFDFSGYTDIAMGIARSFGLKLRLNFNKPFMSENITTFWKRFHISLSSWFNDYIFMRLLFKTRKFKKYATTFALFFTWILFGIWHGAGWNFLLLGLLQAIAIYYEFRSKKWRNGLFSKMSSFYRKWIGRIITYLFYGISLVFFFSPNMDSVKTFFSKITTINETIPGVDSLLRLAIALLFGFLFLFVEVIQTDYTSLSIKLNAFWNGKSKTNEYIRWMVYIMLGAIVIVFNNVGYQFVYFQF